jgi:hypothetical protein
MGLRCLEHALEVDERAVPSEAKGAEIGVLAVHQSEWTRALVGTERSWGPRRRWWCEEHPVHRGPDVLRLGLWLSGGFAVDRCTAAMARPALCRALNRAVGAEAAADVPLATTELITNAIRHGNLHSEEAIRLAAEVDNDRARVALEQPSPANSVRIVQGPRRTRSHIHLANDGFSSAVVKHRPR